MRKHAKCLRDYKTGCWKFLIHQCYNISKHTRGRQSETYCSAVVPGKEGSRMLADWYYLCGYKAYLSLPKGWRGLCALVSLHSHMFFMNKTWDSQYEQLPKRDVVPKTELNWLGLTADTGVPLEWRIWGAGQKFGQG